MRAWDASYGPKTSLDSEESAESSLTTPELTGGRQRPVSLCVRKLVAQRPDPSIISIGQRCWDRGRNHEEPIA
jgi:hypothetical protein